MFDEGSRRSGPSGTRRGHEGSDGDVGCEDEGGGDLLALWRSRRCWTPPTCGDDATLSLTNGKQAGEDSEGRNEKMEAKMPFLCNLCFTYAKLFI